MNKEIKFAMKNKIIGDEGIFWCALQKQKNKSFDLVLKFENGTTTLVRIKKLLKRGKFLGQIIVCKKPKKKKTK